jgi:hypothetical protein
VPFVYPALHRHCDTDELRLFKVSANGPHDVHAVAPDTLEYVSVGQDVLWLAPVVDTKVPAALFVHVVSAVAASVTENLPAAQLVHA